MSMIKPWKLISLLFILQLLAGCESKLEQTQTTINQQVASVESDLNRLGSEIESGSIRNARLLNEYAQVLKQQKPELSRIADLIAEDATRKGPLYQNLVMRLNDVKAQTVTLDNSGPLLDELTRIKEAAKPSLFNDALTDPINVLADMSDGRLARVGAISQLAEKSAGDGADYGAGSQMVGNPNYGGWQSGSNGTSFWQWYGMYRMLGDLTGRVGYSNWSQNRRYSYYNDYGRSRYTSPKQSVQQSAVETRTRKSFQRKGQSFSSPYAKKRSGSAGLSRSSYTPTKTMSSYSKPKKSLTSSNKATRNTGSFRNSGSRTSRGVRRGK
ncbi:MAG: CHAD domain-containing protein [Moritella sp.]|uniref:CHAD domain-containing protein n=1 Tax=Moritella sp. TaxID=78556 RepID=UPI0029ABFB63|nr:CHAD domain-containing protein [Moritella sp.]MDX2321453.1 CHAD domain-containing protein [Moritella sp.]